MIDDERLQGELNSIEALHSMASRMTSYREMLVEAGWSEHMAEHVTLMTFNNLMEDANNMRIIEAKRAKRRW